jgi:2-polyprenyl-6-hydroxyphenyl methylase/3-demethylubiquinone-9 3-methyltransferase
MTEDQYLEDERDEALAFNQRIEERVHEGFIPDLRCAVRSEYFYKSFWRDPQFIKLFLGEIVDTYLRMLSQYGGPSLKVLDAGCGAGYVSLEIARAGHHVLGIDIAESCIEVAKKTLAKNPYRSGFGSLEYRVTPFRSINGAFDAILFSGVLHHWADVEKEVSRARELLPVGGLLLCYEPCHEKWLAQDAAQVALIRMLLSLSGNWYESFIDTDLYTDPEKFESYIQDIHVEYLTERDKYEPGQSPHDNSATGDEILVALRKNFEELEYKPGFSFIYRLLGGLRGPDHVVSALADFLTTYDQFAVEKGFMNPNGFFFIGRRVA